MTIYKHSVFKKKTHKIYQINSLKIFVHSKLLQKNYIMWPQNTHMHIPALDIYAWILKHEINATYRNSDLSHV